MIAEWPSLFVFVTATNLGMGDTLSDLEVGIDAIASSTSPGQFHPRSLAREMEDFFIRYAPCRDRGAWVEPKPWGRS